MALLQDSTLTIAAGYLKRIRWWRMDQQEKMRQLLAGLWQQHYPSILERVEILSKAAEALHEGRLDSEQREAAESAAHKLAGVLGTFGREEGTNLARSIEKLLSDPTLKPSAARQLQTAITALLDSINS